MTNLLRSALAVALAAVYLGPSPVFADDEPSAEQRMKKDLAGTTYKDGWIAEWPMRWGTRYRARADVAFGGLENPEPQWILDWSHAGESGHQNWTVSLWCQAIINRTWSVEAEAAYQVYVKEWAELDAKLRPELERIKEETSAYVRLARLADLRDKLEAAAKELVKDHHGTMPGLDHDILVAAREELARGRIEFAAGTTRLAGIYRGIVGSSSHGDRERVRPWLDDATERALFLGMAMEGRAARLIPRLPRAEFANQIAAQVRWPIETADVDAAKKKVAEAIEKAQAMEEKDLKIPSVDVGIPDKPETLAELLGEANPAEPKLVRAGAELKSMKATGDGHVLGLEAKQETIEWYACKSNGRIDRVDSDGDVHYQQNCKSRTHRHTRTWKVTFQDLPPGLAVGDTIELYADLVAVKGKKGKTDLTATGRLITCATAKGAPAGGRVTERERCRRAW